jgi:hypothetical protein
MIRAFLIRFNCSGVRVLKNSPSSRMWRYGAAAIAASIRRHMGWDLSRIIASMNCSGSALGGRQRGSSFIKPGVGKRPCFIGNGGCVWEYIGGSRVVGIGLALRKEKGRRWGGMDETPSTANARPLEMMRRAVWTPKPQVYGPSVSDVHKSGRASATAGIGGRGPRVRILKVEGEQEVRPIRLGGGCLSLRTLP